MSQKVPPDFMESLKLKTKLLYLLISVGLGLLVVAFIGYVNLLTMKRNVDTLYFGSMIPLTELSAINTAYHHEFESDIYRWREKLLSDEEFSREITFGITNIDQLWASYRSHHTRAEEVPYITYTDGRIDAMKRYFEDIRSLATKHAQASSISIVTLSDNITSIHNTIAQLISYEISVAAALAAATAFVGVNAIGAGREIAVSTAFLLGFTLRGGQFRSVGPCLDIARYRLVPSKRNRRMPLISGTDLPLGNEIPFQRL